MKIAIASTFVPFVNGGAKNIVEWLASKLEDLGHDVEVVLIPQAESPATILNQMAAIRAIDLSSADLLICIRPQAHLIRHPRKVVWFIHHLRMFYDWWDSEYRYFPDSEKNQHVRDIVFQEDNLALNGAAKIYTNSAVVSERLKKFNHVSSMVLYPPLSNPELYSTDEPNNEIVYVGRVEKHKRQHLFIEAMARVNGNCVLRIIGQTSSVVYQKKLYDLIHNLGLEDRVIFTNKWESEENKRRYLSKCLAVAYAPFDEDSYGYPTLEAAHSSKPVITTSDSGGVLEFVQHGKSGLVSDPTVHDLAISIQTLLGDKYLARKLGEGASLRVLDLGISWDHVIKELLN